MPSKQILTSRMSRQTQFKSKQTKPAGRGLFLTHSYSKIHISLSCSDWVFKVQTRSKWFVLPPSSPVFGWDWFGAPLSVRTISHFTEEGFVWGLLASHHLLGVAPSSIAAAIAVTRRSLIGDRRTQIIPSWFKVESSQVLTTSMPPAWYRSNIWSVRARIWILGRVVIAIGNLFNSTTYREWTSGEKEFNYITCPDTFSHGPAGGQGADGEIRVKLRLTEKANADQEPIKSSSVHRELIQSTTHISRWKGGSFQNSWLPNQRVTERGAAILWYTCVWGVD